MKLAFPKLDQPAKAISKTIQIISLICIILFALWNYKWFIIQTNHVLSFYYVFQGDQQYSKGNFQEAIDKYNQGLNLYPAHTKAQYNLGNIYVSYEDFNSAAECYKKAVEINPRYINARINLGIILNDYLSDIDGAINQYQEAIKTPPKNINIPFIYSNVLRINLAKAIVYYNLGLAYRDKSLQYKSDSFGARDYLEKAVYNYKKSIELNMDNYGAHYNLAIALQLLGLHTEAIQEYCKAINFKPLNYGAHYNLAILLRSTQKYKESVKELEKAGLILNSKGDDKANYIYQVLNEVSQKAIIQNRTEFLKDKKNNDKDGFTYSSGKVVLTKDMEKIIITGMKACNYCLSN